MKVQVTQQHIWDGTQNDCNNCPVALAVKQALNVDRGVEVGDWFIGVLGTRYPTPEDVVDFILAYDTDQHVEPFEFELPNLGQETSV